MSPSNHQPISVLFVCLGNICRSTMAEGVFTSLTSTAPYTSLISRIDSCGTGAYHIGADADKRTLSTLMSHSITYSHCARKLAPSDFDTFDFIFVMDEMNLEDVVAVRRRRVAGKGKDGVGRARVMLWGEFGRERRMEDIIGIGECGTGCNGRVGVEEVDDPYYGGKEGFEIAYEQCARFSKNFLKCVFPGL